MSQRKLSCEEIGVVTARQGHWAPVSIITKDTPVSIITKDTRKSQVTVTYPAKKISEIIVFYISERAGHKK